MAEDNFDEFDDLSPHSPMPIDDGLDELDEPQQRPTPVQQSTPQPQRMKPRTRPQQRPMSPQNAAAQALPLQQQAQQPQQQAIQQAQQVQAQARFIPYEIPKKIGLLDRSTGRPIIEDEDMLKVVMAQLADLKNDLEEIKAQLG